MGCGDGERFGHLRSRLPGGKGAVRVRAHKLLALVVPSNAEQPFSRLPPDFSDARL